MGVDITRKVKEDPHGWLRKTTGLMYMQLLMKVEENRFGHIACGVLF